MKSMSGLLAPFALAAAISGVSAVAQAATVTYYKGNECGAGGFSGCTYDGSPTIVKFNGTGFTLSEISTGFPSITGDEFTFAVSQYNKEQEPIAGSFTYTPGAGDPLITAFAVKAGNGYNLYTDLTPGESFGMDWATPGGKGLSHITFFDGGIPTVPLPAGGLLLVTGIGATFALRKRKTA